MGALLKRYPLGRHSVLRSAGLFAVASCAAPLVAMLRTAASASVERLKFGYEFIPVALVLWAVMGAGYFGGSAVLAWAAARFRAIQARGLLVVGAAGVILGSSLVAAVGLGIQPGWWPFAALVLAPVLFRARAT